MEARCYRGGDGRTRMKKMEFGKNDYTSLIVLLIFVMIVVVMMMVL
jgi:energy-coupling factor transport system permease protein